MPRSVPGGLAPLLTAESTSLCYLIKIVRKDGFTLGFATIDVPLVYDGLTYEPTDGMSASAVESQVGTGVGNMEVIGVLTDDRITEEDVAAGLWGGASVYIYRTDWKNISAGVMTEYRGFIGTIDQSRVTVSAEVDGLAQLQQQTVGWQTSKNCACRRLGNAQCKVVMSGNTVGGVPIRANKTLASGSGTSLVFSSDSAPTGHYSHGTVKFTSGPNTNIEREVKVHSLVSGNAEISLRTPFPFAVTPGQTALLEAGCDRTWLTCKTKFANRNNFHGQAELPGNDKILKVGRPPG